MFLVALVVAVVKLAFLGDTEVFTALVNATFEMAKTGFEISLGLTGVLTLWLGLMRLDSHRRLGGVRDLLELQRLVGTVVADRAHRSLGV